MKSSPVIHADMTDILYADRNQAYGGYQIRKEYPKNVVSAFVYTTAAMVGLLLFLYYNSKSPQLDSILPDKSIILTEVQVIPNQKPPIPEPKATPPAPVEKKKKEQKAPPQEKGMDTQESKKIVADPNAQATATVAADSLFKDKQPGLVTTDTSNSNAVGGDPRGTATTPTDNALTTETPGEGSDSTDTDIPPPFKPHLGTMPIPKNLDHIRKAIGYPAGARDLGMDGKVIYRVLVDENGKYLRHMVLKSSHPIFEKACAKQLSKVEFEPGKMG
ncbi:MAG: energy transducer TonB, partial [Bacteroidota bacterium]